MKKRYINKRFYKKNQARIPKINYILDDYMAQDLKLTIRQIFYQLVARGEIDNEKSEYESIVSLCTNARMGGRMDWDAIVDRTRSFIRNSHWTSGAEILESASQSFYMDRWENQCHRVFCVIEKEALSGILEPVCLKYDVPLLAARGYSSVTVLREFAVQHIIPALHDGQDVIIFYLGDHDPSGVDMPRYIKARLTEFKVWPFELISLGLSRGQIEQFKLPPNTAKEKDSRWKDYVREHGELCWELDALPPDELVRLIKEGVQAYIDEDRWQESADAIKTVKTHLSRVTSNF